MTRFAALLCASAICVAAPLAAKDSLGVYDNWAAFRDPGTPRCYAIAKPSSSSSRRDFAPYASVATWPARDIRNQFHARLSRDTGSGGAIRLVIGDTSFDLAGGGGDAWARDARMDAAIVAAMRSATRMSISATSASGNRFTDRYQLSGVASAIDAAVVGCAQIE